MSRNNAKGWSRRGLKRKNMRRINLAVMEPMEGRVMMSASPSPLGLADTTLAGATDLGAFKLHAGRNVRGAVGVTTTDAVYKVEVSSEINLSLTLGALQQKDNVYLMYADGSLINSGYQNSKPTLKISQHLDPGTYFIDVQHGYVADNSSLAKGAAKVKVTPVKRYHLKVTTGFTLGVRGLKADDSIAPQEPIKPAGFAAAFGATGAAAEPSISASLASSTGFNHFEPFTAAEGYVLWGAGGPLPDDEIQQQLGDCYFMSIISSIARNDPGLIEKSIVAQNDGTFVVKFQSNGQEVDEQVDDSFPVNGNGQTIFAGIPTDKAIWPAILEKAWTYFRPSSTSKGSYDGIQLGFPSESLKAFGSTDAADIGTASFTTAAQLLTTLSGKLQAGDLVDIGTKQPANWPTSDPPLPSGLFIGHEYSVVTVDVASSSVQLRNPWATNHGGGLDGSNGYITLTGDQLISSVDDYSFGSLAAVTPNPNPTPTPTPTPTPVPTNTNSTTQTLAENLGPDSYQANDGTNFDFFSFTANTNNQANVTITSNAFVPELLIAQLTNNGWTTVGSNQNAGSATSVNVKFTATPGVTYGIGVFVGTAADTGAYTLEMDGDLSAPVQSTPDAATGSLSGVVYNDANSDGSQDNGEIGVAGRTVYIDLNNSGQFADGDPITTTDANGAYKFTGLQAGNYTVNVEPTSGWTPTENAAGVATAVTAGQDTAVGHFGEVQQGGGGISGTVYSDANGNGTQDAGEAGLAGWYVFIDLAGTGVYANGDPYVSTDANGHYLFQGLTPGSYTTYIFPETGFTTIEGSTGWDNTVSASQSSVGGNFGEAQPSGTISGQVYLDANGNGVADAGDTALAGWQVYLDLGNTGSYVSGDPFVATDGSGNYTFTGIAAGTYTVRVIGQTGYTTDEGSLGWIATAVAGTNSNGGSFGESQATGSISGTVYNDSNRDGTLDGFESGVSNWAVYIDLNNDGVYDGSDIYVLTDSNGGYSVTGLAPGQYVVRAYVYSNLHWTAGEGSAGWTATVVGNQNNFGGNFGEHT